MSTGAAQAALEIAIALLKRVGIAVAIRLLKAYLRQRRAQRRRTPPSNRGGRRKRRGRRRRHVVR